MDTLGMYRKLLYVVVYMSLSHIFSQIPCKIYKIRNKSIRLIKLRCIKSSPTEYLQKRQHPIHQFLSNGTSLVLNGLEDLVRSVNHSLAHLQVRSASAVILQRTQGPSDTPDGARVFVHGSFVYSSKRLPRVLMCKIFMLQ